MNRKTIRIIMILIALLFAGIQTVNKSQEPQEKNTYNEPGGPEYAVVNRIVDGDTFVAQIGYREERIRLIGVDTPETVDPRKPVQCFGKEAFAALKTYILGKRVLLEKDLSQKDRDTYQRLLRYVYLEDEAVSVNEKLIADGYAYEYTYVVPYQYQELFKQREEEARLSLRGLWNPLACTQKT